MKKNYITREYTGVPTPGTLTTQERKHFFGGKMMDIEDEIRIGTSSIIGGAPAGVITYETLIKGQHAAGPSLVVGQSLSELQNKAKWEIIVDTRGLLEEYLYNELAIVNINDDFKSISEHNIATGKLSDMVIDYVRTNLLSKYQMTKLLVWVKYYELSTLGPVVNGLPVSLLQYTPIYHIDAKDAENKTPPEVDKTAIPLLLGQTTDKRLKATFKQEEASKFYTFAYYYDIVFTKA